MIVFGQFLIAIGQLLHWVIVLFYWLLIIHAVLSFVSPDPRNPIVQFIHQASEPILYRIRQKVPPIGMFDLSVLVALGGLLFIDYFIAGSLLKYGNYYSNSVRQAVGF